MNVHVIWKHAKFPQKLQNVQQNLFTQSLVDVRMSRAERDVLPAAEDAALHGSDVHVPLYTRSCLSL